MKRLSKYFKPFLKEDLDSALLRASQRNAGQVYLGEDNGGQ